MDKLVCWYYCEAMLGGLQGEATNNVIAMTKHRQDKHD